MEKKIQIPAVHDKDLRSILDRFGVSELIDKGKVHCNNCNKQITWDNLFAFKIVNESAIMFCDEPDCIEKSST
jgi:hypothetical protein